MNKRIVLLILALLFVLFMVILYFVLSSGPAKKNTPAPTPTPTLGSVQQNTSYSNTKAVDKNTTDAIDKSYKVTQLVSVLPYKGKNASLYYDFKTNTFTLYINPALTSEGNKEFDLFLKQNGIARSWMTNMVIVYKNVNPAP